MCGVSWYCRQSVCLEELQSEVGYRQVRIQDFSWGDTEAARVHFFLKKVDDLFLVVTPSKLELSQLWSQNTTLVTSDRENSVTLLNKAGAEFQQTHSCNTAEIL